MQVAFYERTGGSLGPEKGTWVIARKNENLYVITVNYDEGYTTLKDEIIATFKFSPRSDAYLDYDYNTVEVSE